MRDRTNIRDALENHEENKNKDLSSTICEFVSLECTPQVRYRMHDLINKADLSLMYFCVFRRESTDLVESLALLHHREAT